MYTCFTPLANGILPPERFNCPYYYVAHPLAVSAMAHVKDEIASKDEWRDEICRGKMFGVLVVRDVSGAIGYLKAFSGQILSQSEWEGWVPPVFDYLQPDGYFVVHEREISEINSTILALETSPQSRIACLRLSEAEESCLREEEEYRKQMQAAKERRDALRQQCHDASSLIRESQFMKAEMRRLKRRHEETLLPLRHAVAEWNTKLASLRKERKEKSDALQTWLFRHFVVRNVKGEEKDLCDIFADTPLVIPPSGAGECCAPKLLQYAFLHGYEPLCMAEFWWGRSPAGEIRHHGECYPACQGKCRPILDFMLQGMDVEANPLDGEERGTITMVYEDPWLVAVDKPSGMLSVPGKGRRLSAQEILSEERGGAAMLCVHRLDMQTSGILLFAKDVETQREMQRAFALREVHKVYYAVVRQPCEASMLRTGDEGDVVLPLSPDYLNRPRQKVDKETGKEAVTHYTVLDADITKARLELQPKTGRTHQLRVHCAHREGLNAPIVGDELYGTPDSRMLLHAARMTFVHPKSSEVMTLSSPCPF